MVPLFVAAVVASLVTVSPSAGGRHDRFAVAIVAGHAAGPLPPAARLPYEAGRGRAVLLPRALTNS
jgi:hypothetical protein